MDLRKQFEKETGNKPSYQPYMGRGGETFTSDYVKWLEAKAGKHETVIGNKWTSVEDEPLADITIEGDGMSTTVTYDNYLSGADMLFAVPLGNGEYSICRGYIEDDGSIQEIFQSGTNEWWGYSLEDVTHYMEILNPKR